MKKLFALLLTLLFCASAELSAQDFKIENGQFLHKGKPIQFICGEMHYPRVPQEYWRDRVRRLKAMGINTISTYVFWSFHERRPGEFDFRGQADLAKFIRICGEEGMYVVLRPGPYVCAEWDFGGYPYWLQKEQGMVWRSDNEAFLKACRRYIMRLGKEVASLCVTKGGPIMLVQVENEYGSYSNDKVYLGKLRDMIREAGFDAPLITCDGSGQMPNGYIDGALPTVNGSVGEEVIRTIDRFHKGGPYFVAEFYPAWFDVWGKAHSRRDYRSPAEQLDWMLGNNVSVSIYMAHGGTNFCYTNGANTSYGYEPQPTSYDYDAPLGEYGNPTPKYYAFREVIQKHLPEGETLPDVPALNPISTFPAVTLTQQAPLSAAFTRRIQSEQPLTMEDADMDFGYIHYETTLPAAAKGLLVIKELRDYGVVSVNGKNVGSLDRRHRQNKIEVDIPAGGKLEILVENVGRVNYGPDLLNNLKGITEKVTLGGKPLTGWTTTPLPLYASVAAKGAAEKQLNKAFSDITESNLSASAPTFYRGTFELASPGDLFLDTRGWCKGAVWVNGRSIGKYWAIGPQHTLYVPGPWVKKGKNEIIVLDLEPTGHRSIAGLPAPILDSLGVDKHKSASAGREALGEPILDEGDVILSGEMKQEAGFQQFRLASPATLRHLCIEVLSSYDGQSSCLSEIELLDGKGNPVNADSWKIVYASTEEPVVCDAELMFDGDAKTMWHSRWNGTPSPYPHRLIIDLGEIQTISAVRLAGRKEVMPGAVKAFRLYGRPQFFLFK